jgi:hypothetical protein
VGEERKESHSGRREREREGGKVEEEKSGETRRKCK